MSDQGLTEQCVGITEFLSPPDTFEKITGIIKARYSDFNVYEIDKKGNTIHLTDFGPGNSWDSIQNYFVAKRAKGKEDIYSKKLDQNEVSSLVEEIPLENATFEEPKQLIEETVEPNEEASVHELIQEEANIENANLVNEKTGLIVTEEIRQNISDFMIATFGEVDLAAHMVELIEKKRFQGETCLVFPSVSDKQRRTKIHFFVKELSSKIENVLVTDTIDKDKIRVSYRFPNSRKRKQDFDDRNHLNVTEKRADFIICHMYKENKDTMEASSRISSALRISSKDISYAGTKDRRGITVQQIAISTKGGGMTIERLAGLNKFLGPTQGIYLGNFKYGHTSFGLGDLSGNRFEILLRDIKPVATEGIYSADNGTFVQDKRQFISNLLTHLGTEGFLNYYGMQRFGQSKVCPTYCVGIAVLKNDWKEAIDLIMNPREGERDAIEEARILWKMTQQVKKALDKIPRRWVAERSILYYFSQPGVSTSDCLGAFQRIPHELRLMYLHSFQSLIWNQVASYRVSIFGKRPVIGDIVYSRENSKKDLKEDYEEINIENSEKNSKVIYVLKNETDLSNYTLADVLIPLPGYSIQYPSHLIPYYQELITSYGIPFDTFGKFGKQASITLAGSYRKLICIPKDLQAEFIQYEDPNESILEKDLDRLINPTQPDIKEKKTKDLESSRKYLGLKLSFSLPSSAYATMALREFLRVDTGAAYQRSLCPEPFKKL